MRVAYKPLGLVKDVPAHDVADEYYTDAENVKFRDGAAVRSAGYQQSFGTLSHAPVYLLPVIRPSNYYMIYAGRNAVAVSDGNTQYNITPAAGWSDNYPAKITGDNLNSLPFLNNPNDAPVYWDGVTSNVMQPLPNWPANTTCKALRSFKYFIVAMNTTEASNNYPHKIMWSNSAEPGAVPSTWVAAANNDAGDNLLASEPGGIVDGLALRDNFVIYKQHSCYLMQHVGGNDVMAFRELFANVGILSQGCVVESEGKHYVLTDGDFVVHDGHVVKSLLSERLRDWLFNNINTNYGDTCYITHNVTQSEIWICFPFGSANTPDTALIYNYMNDTYGVRDIPNCPHIVSGITGAGLLDETWNLQTETWDTINRQWDRRNYTPTADGLVMAGYSASELYDVDAADTADGASITAHVSKESMDLGEISAIKTVRRVWPRITGNTGDTIEVTLGYQMEAGDAITWGSATSFTIGTDDYITAFAKGRLISIKFSDTSNNKWKVHGFDIEFEPAGRY